MTKAKERGSRGKKPEIEFREIPVDAIQKGELSLRHCASEEGMEELRCSIRKHGVLVPVLVKELKEGYELIAGLRRYLCSAANGLATIPAMIVRRDDRWGVWATVAENRLREAVNAVDEAVYIAAVLSKHSLTSAQAAELLGVSESWVSQRLSLLRWPEDVREAVRDGVISFAVGRELAGIKDDEMRRYCLSTARRCGCSVRQAAMWRRNWLKDQAGGEGPEHEGTAVDRLGGPLLEHCCVICDGVRLAHDGMTAFVCSSCLQVLEKRKSRP